METLLKDLDEAISELPTDAPCTSTRKAPELLAFITVMQSCIAFCEAFLREKDENASDRRMGRPHPDPPAFVDHARRSWKPWLTHRHITWTARHAQLRHIMVARHENLSQDVIIQGKFYRPLELCQILASLIIQCCFECDMPEAWINPFRAYDPPPEIKSAELLLEASVGGRGGDEAFLSFERMPMTMLMDHLYWLMARWGTLRYSDALRKYILLLEMRASMLMTRAHSMVENDAPDLHLELQPKKPGESEADALVRARFGSNASSLSIFTCIFHAVYERMHWCRFFLSSVKALDIPAISRIPAPFVADPEDDSEIYRQERRERSRKIRAFFRRRAAAARTRIPSDWLRSRYPVEMIWPGERELFAITNAAEMGAVQSAVSALTIIRKTRTTDSVGVAVHPLLMRSRGSHYDKIVAAAESPQADIITRELDEEPPESAAGTESPLLRLALHEHFSHFVRELYGAGLEFDRYVVMRDAIPFQLRVLMEIPPTPEAVQEAVESGANPDAKMEDYYVMPYIVQLFNHWSLVYHKRVYQLDSYIDALSLWLLIIERCYQARVGFLNLEDLINAVFDSERDARIRSERLRRAAGNNQFVFSL